MVKFVATLGSIFGLGVKSSEELHCSACCYYASEQLEAQMPFSASDLLQHGADGLKLTKTTSLDTN